MLSLKRLIFYFLCFAVLFVLSPVPRASGEEEFTGVIADSQCAMNVHSLSQSHKEMLKSKEAGTTRRRLRVVLHLAARRAVCAAKQKQNITNSTNRIWAENMREARCGWRVRSTPKRIRFT